MCSTVDSAYSGHNNPWLLVLGIFGGILVLMWILGMFSVDIISGVYCNIICGSRKRDVDHIELSLFYLA